MPYIIEVADDVSAYLATLTHILPSTIELLLATAEAELAANAEAFYARDSGPADSYHFNYENPIGDGVTQYLFRFVVTMEFAAQGVVRVVFADHEVLGTIEPG